MYVYYVKQKTDISITSKLPSCNLTKHLIPRPRFLSEDTSVSNPSSLFPPTVSVDYWNSFPSLSFFSFSFSILPSCG